MRRAIGKHLRDFIAMLGMAAIALAVGGYILSKQRLRFPVVEPKPFVVKAEFSDAQAVVPGQGQTVRIAGMKVGDIGQVELKDGRAIVSMELDQEFDDVVHTDATALLRPRTGLKDMFIELDPGSRSEALMEEGEVLPSNATAPDVDADEILSALDTDTRAYLRLLIVGAGKGLRGRGGDLREVFRRLGPLHRDLARINGKVATRRRNLARLIHNTSSTFRELSKKDDELATFVDASNRVFGALASEDRNISLAVSRLPGTLDQAERTLGTVNRLGAVAGPAFESLRPPIRRLAPANAEVRPLAREGEPILRRQVRPFVRAARPFVANLRPAARNLVKASPDLRDSFFELNRFFNMAAYNPDGSNGLTGNMATDRRRDEGYLFWLGWVAQNGVSVFSTGDAQGPFRRFFAGVNCDTIDFLIASNPASGPLLGLSDIVNNPALCPP